MIFLLGVLKMPSSEMARLRKEVIYVGYGVTPK